MTLQEVAAALGKSLSTLQNNFPRTQEALAKRGIILTKWGWGKNAEYEIEYEKLEELELEEE